MSGRTYAQISVSTWTDDDYRALPGLAKALYVAMLSHPSLNGLGVGAWDLHEFVAFDPDSTPEAITSTRSALIARRYVVVDDTASRYAIRSYLRTNSHLVNNPKNARGLVNAYRATTSKRMRHSALYELRRLQIERPNLHGWPIVQELFDAAKFDFTMPPSPDGSGDLSPIGSSDRSSDTTVDGSTDGSTVRSISTQYSLLSTQNSRPKSGGATAAEKPRPELEALCERLANAVEKNEFKRPAINKTALRAARLLIDKDKYTVAQVEWMIDWTAQDSFWYKNIQSMASLREKFDRLKADADVAKRNGGTPTAPKVDPNWALKRS